MKKIAGWIASLALFMAFPAFGAKEAAKETAKVDAPRVRLTTTKGVIELELNAVKAPETVKNFLEYVQAGHYDGTVFHRVIPGFMIQGGGFAPGMKEKPTRAPIKNEADNGLKNLTGTIAMARRPDPDSASAQFFINVKDNASLDHRSTHPRDYGYCVFGRVVAGLEVVRAIETVATGQRGMHGDVPREDVVIQKAELLPAKK